MRFIGRALFVFGTSVLFTHLPIEAVVGIVIAAMGIALVARGDR